jgi:hypothetical protein
VFVRLGGGHSRELVSMDDGSSETEKQ